MGTSAMTQLRKVNLSEISGYKPYTLLISYLVNAYIRTAESTVDFKELSSFNTFFLLAKLGVDHFTEQSLIIP